MRLRGMQEAYKEKWRKKFVGQRLGVTPKSCLTFFFVSLKWACRVHDEKSTFLLIFECLWLFSTMQTHAQACVRWSKYTTTMLCWISSLPKRSKENYNCLIQLGKGRFSSHLNIIGRQNKSLLSSQPFTSLMFLNYGSIMGMIFLTLTPCKPTPFMMSQCMQLNFVGGEVVCVLRKCPICAWERKVGNGKNQHWPLDEKWICTFCLCVLSYVTSFSRMPYCRISEILFLNNNSRQ